MGDDIEIGWGPVSDRLEDHEGRLRTLEYNDTTCKAERTAFERAQREKNEKAATSSARLHERVNELPDKDDMHQITERMTSFTSEMEQKFRREEAERRKVVDKITDGQQQMLRAIERDKGRQEASEKHGVRVSAWLIPLVTAIVGVVLTYLLTR